MTVQFLLHTESSGFASRKDLAIVYDDRITAVFTLGVENGNTVGSFHRPFFAGQTVDEASQAVEDYNTSVPVRGAVCRCGSDQQHHTRSAVCADESNLKWLWPNEVLAEAIKAKRSSVGELVWALVYRAARRGEITLPLPIPPAPPAEPRR